MENRKNPYVIELKTPVVFEGEEYKEIDLTGSLQGKGMLISFRRTPWNMRLTLRTGHLGSPFSFLSS